MLTDKQARENICPLIRYCVNQTGVVQDRDSAIYEHAPCQGSECSIGWRWAESERAARYRIPGDPKDADLSGTRLGYCGAFGRPENV